MNLLSFSSFVLSLTSQSNLILIDVASSLTNLVLLYILIAKYVDPETGNLSIIDKLALRIARFFMGVLIATYVANVWDDFMIIHNATASGTLINVVITGILVFLMIPLKHLHSNSDTTVKK